MFVIFTRVPIGKADEMVYCKGHTRYLSALGFWNIEFEKNEFDELDFLSISNSNFAGYTGSKNLKSVWKWMSLYKWPLYDLFWPFFAYVCSSFAKLMFWWSFWGA